MQTRRPEPVSSWKQAENSNFLLNIVSEAPAERKLIQKNWKLWITCHGHKHPVFTNFFREKSLKNTFKKAHTDQIHFVRRRMQTKFWERMSIAFWNGYLATTHIDQIHFVVMIDQKKYATMMRCYVGFRTLINNFTSKGWLFEPAYFVFPREIAFIHRKQSSQTIYRSGRYEMIFGAEEKVYC